MLLIHSALAGAVVAVIEPWLGFVTFLSFYIFGILGNLALGLWLHLWAFVFGARGIGKTLSIVFLGSTPSYLIGWIPQIGIFRLVLLAWSFGLYYLGFRALGLAQKKAAPAIIISLALGLAILVALSYLAFSYFLPLIYSLAL